ncbi:MAG: hypothetical protein HDQ87_11850 [Clostridia bacterium]|nr:hypothetical protein [Clostridia bacterium]
MSKKETVPEKLHSLAEKVETEIREHEQKHEEAVRERDKEIRHEKKMFEKHEGSVQEAGMLALEDEDIVTSD